MRFLLDVNVGTTIGRAIAGAGHEVVYAAHQAPRARDEFVLSRAVREHCVLVTYDRDYGELVFRRIEPTPLGIVYIRHEPEDVRDIVPRILPLLEPSLLTHYLTVIDKNGIRRRPFPEVSNEHG